jgi:pSer/pThr/pTyr-binding forkhead associated (FHA) protein
MGVRLLVKQRGEAGGAEKGSEVILNDEVITLGRDQTCQVVLAQKAVSRSHARISQDGPLFFIEDLGSAYGTTVNGEMLSRGEKRLLRNGDTIAIAQFDLTFDRLADLPKNANEKTSYVARKVVKDVMRGTGEGPFFRIMNGPSEGQRIELTEGQELIVGRDAGSANIVLKDDMVSRRHAKIRRDWSGTHVEDLESRNGVKVNKRRVTTRTLKDRDEVEIGSIRLLYLDPSEVREAPVMPAEEVESTQAVPEPNDEMDAKLSGESALGEEGEEDADAEAGEGADDDEAQDDEAEEGEEGLEDEEYDEDAEEEEGPPPTGIGKYLAMLPLPKKGEQRRQVLVIGIMAACAILAVGLIIAALFV